MRRRRPVQAQSIAAGRATWNRPVMADAIMRMGLAGPSVPATGGDRCASTKPKIAQKARITLRLHGPVALLKP